MTDTRNHIMEVARSQFFKTGFSGTSINSIVDATKFTKPTVYYHFKNKAELFASLVHDAYDRCFEHRRNAVDPRLSASEQLYQAVAADFAFCLATPDLVRFVVALTFALPGDHSIDLSAVHSRDHEWFRALIEDGMSSGEFDCVNSGDAAIALQGLIAINIMSYLKMGHPPEFLSAERARDVADVLLKGIAAQGKRTAPKKGPRKRNSVGV
jgi:AcrR family transcriptional regulator